MQNPNETFTMHKCVLPLPVSYLYIYTTQMSVNPIPTNMYGHEKLTSMPGQVHLLYC